MNTLPTIENYGEYSSSNYGANSLTVRFSSGLQLWYSYTTIVAFKESWSAPIRVRENDWSKTTGKHLNWIDRGDKKERINGEDFEKELHAVLVKHNLASECTACGQYPCSDHASN